jgi:hypothetical protein
MQIMHYQLVCDLFFKLLKFSLNSLNTDMFFECFVTHFYQLLFRIVIFKCALLCGLST